MSLKAYDGLMTTKGIKYIQDGIIERLDRLRKASQKKLYHGYCDMVMEIIDHNVEPESLLKSYSDDRITQDLLKTITIEDNTTLLSLLYQISNVRNKSFFVNDFTVHLNISLEVLEDKILIYPNILVPEHRNILLEFLTDYYAQNQSDPDPKVPKEEWELRCKEWYKFNEVSGFDLKIRLFDPNDLFSSINKQLRGDELINGIIENMPDRSKRAKRMALNKIFAEELKKRDLKEKSDQWSLFHELNNKYLNTEEGKQELNEYILVNIKPLRITKELLETKVKDL